MDVSSFLFKWQNLIGSAVGPLAAILFSIIGFWSNGRKERRETLRRIEVYAVRILNTLWDTKKALLAFKERIQNIITEGEELLHEEQNNARFLSRTQFPSIEETYPDDELAGVGLRSAYLHNLLISITTGTRRINKRVHGLEESYRDIIALNEQIVFDGNTDRQNQIDLYTNNLRGFLRAIDNIIESLDEGTKFALRTKIYNGKMRRYPFFFVWKHEKPHFKYFKDRDAIQKYKNYPEYFDRINKILEERVEKEIEEVLTRES